ncbi:MAG: toll/interleukin-1 receptor domain-containing protein [Deltaproteobacteria bacterium]|nr:toll/interleukin-1 receptor domain-containing protein [Deltaproteobacteria bacterium]
MGKETIFFSHSSYDEKLLKKLREFILLKTGNAIEVFMSIDGQSIPLGRNWVHKIEEALNNSKLMIVFISPHSLNSHWIYFEAGFSYCKEVRVVPVGVLGVDLEQIPPPLSLLQGFNIKDARGLNNIIALINEAFSHKHEESFTESEYNEIFTADTTLANSTLQKYATVIHEIQFKISGPTNIESTLQEIHKKLIEKGIECQSTKYSTYTYGLSFVQDDKNLAIKLDPNLTGITFPILNDLIKELNNGAVEPLLFSIIFIPSINYCEALHKLTARIYQTGIRLASNGSLIYDNLEFTLERPMHIIYENRTHKFKSGSVRMQVKYLGENLSEMKLFELLDILFESNILYFEE